MFEPRDESRALTVTRMGAFFREGLECIRVGYASERCVRVSTANRTCLCFGLGLKPAGSSAAARKQTASEVEDSPARFGFASPNY